MEEEEIKKIAEIREILEGKIKDLEAELEWLRSLLNFINSILVEKSFKRAGEMARPVDQFKASTAEAKVLRTIPLKTTYGEILANMIVEEDQIRIVPAPDKRFDVNTPPFMQFLIERILEKMREKDEDLARQGKLMPDRIFSYEIEKDGNILREIRIKNFDSRREREIRSAARWTFEKMYEKMLGASQ